MYRTIGTEIWTDPRFEVLPPLGKLLFIHLFTNHHAHVCGLYHIRDSYICDETGIPQRTLDTLWDTLSEIGLVWRDNQKRMVWVKNMLKRQGSGEKVWRSTANHLRTLHNCIAIKWLLDKYPEVKKYLPDTPCDTPSEFGNPNEELEQDKELEQEQNKDTGEKPDSQKKEPPTGFLRFWKLLPAKARDRSSRKDSLAEWTRLGCEGRVDEVVAGLDRWKRSESWANKGGEYIPGAHRWLKSEKWVEFPAPAHGSNGDDGFYSQEQLDAIAESNSPANDNWETFPPTE